jgi:hypothetical protein
VARRFSAERHLQALLAGYRGACSTWRAARASA